MMRLEKFPLRNLAENVLSGNVPRRPFIPPSLVPEMVVEQPDLPVLPAPPALTEADLRHAEQEGYRRGFLEGAKEGQMQAQSEQAEIDRQLTESVAQAAQKLGGMIAAYNAFVQEQRQQLPPLALAIARKVAGDALEANPGPLVESLALRCLERLLGEPEIVITVNSRLSDALEHRLITHFTGSSDPGEINIQSDPDLPAGDCRIEWRYGSAEHNTEELWRQMEAIIQNMAEAGNIPQAAPQEAAVPPLWEATQADALSLPSPMPPNQQENNP